MLEFMLSFMDITHKPLDKSSLVCQKNTDITTSFILTIISLTEFFKYGDGANFLRLCWHKAEPLCVDLSIFVQREILENYLIFICICPSVCHKLIKFKPTNSNRISVAVKVSNLIQLIQSYYSIIK